MANYRGTSRGRQPNGAIEGSHIVIRVHIPSLLRDKVGGAETVEAEVPPGGRITVRQLLERLDTRYPGLLEALTYQDDLLPGIAIFIDNDQALMGLQAQVEAGSDVRFLPPIVGG